MTRFLLHGVAWLVVACVAPLVSSGEVDGSARGLSAAQAGRVGREFRVRVGRLVTFERGSLRLKFKAVAEDSRCPVNVDCVWAGNAEVLIEVSAKGGSEKQVLKLNTNASPERPSEGRYGRYTVKLLGLSPQPRAGRKIAAGAYTATLLVSKE